MKNKILQSFFIAVLIVNSLPAMLCVSSLRAEEGKEDVNQTAYEKFGDVMQLETTAEKVSLVLSTSIISLTGRWNERDIQIDLIGTIHFAPGEYYQLLNEKLTAYPIVLFEMVLPPGVGAEQVAVGHKMKITDIQSPLDIVGLAQQWLSDLLGFIPQLDGIDYKKKNMKHCDIDSKTLLDLIVEQENLDDIAIESVSDLAAFLPFSGKELGWIVEIYFSGDRKKTLRRLVAREIFDSLAGYTEPGAEEEIGFGQRALILARNKVVIDRLKKEMLAGQNHLGTIYGAAHIPQLRESIEQEFGLTVKEVTWIPAWQMR